MATSTDYNNIKRKRRNKRVIGIIIIILLILLMLFTIAFLLCGKKEDTSDHTPLNAVGMYEYKEQLYKQRDDIITVLLVGTNQRKAEYIAVIVVDKDDKTYLPIKLNRNLICNHTMIDEHNKIIGSIDGRLGNAFTYGTGDLDSLVNLKDAVSKLMCNARIDYYVAFDINGMGEFTKNIGGLNIKMEKDYTYLDPTYKEGKTITFNGENILPFMVGDEDIETIDDIEERQTRFFVELEALCKERYKSDELFFDKMLTDFTGKLLMNSNDIVNIASDATAYVRLPKVFVKGDYDDKDFIVDEDFIRDLCLDSIYRK